MESRKIINHINRSHLYVCFVKDWWNNTIGFGEGKRETRKHRACAWRLGHPRLFSTERTQQSRTRALSYQHTKRVDENTRRSVYEVKGRDRQNPRVSPLAMHSHALQKLTSSNFCIRARGTRKSLQYNAPRTTTPSALQDSFLSLFDTR